MTRLEKLLNNPIAYGMYKTNSLRLATQWAREGRMWTEVILGSDGLFWVPSTNKDVNILRRAGYSVA